MGFYGKVNRTDSNFVIDVTYGNRAEMEDALLKDGGDGVFIGRYVLVDYNKGTAIEDNYVRLYRKDNWSYFFRADFAPATRAIYSEKPYFITDDNGKTTINPEYKEDIKTNPYLIFQDQPIYVVSETDDYVFYQCIRRWNSTKYPLFELMSEAPIDTDNYYYNFAYDRERYGNKVGRGWDSTVWQKIYVDETEQYAMIAELNSVVPTFDITTDAPTLSPIAPHFDADSTNVYYKLHVQPSWGLRVAKAASEKESDTMVSHEGLEVFDPPEELKKDWDNSLYEDWYHKSYPGAIYFNKKGFDPLIHYNSNGLKDEIKLLPTGESGNKYNISHNGGIVTKEKKPDIQELTIHLPSIGDSISKMWDMIYGDGEGEADENGGLKRNDNIAWDNVAGLRLVSAKRDGNGFEYKPDQVNTLAGCINSVHDLMGMIITDDKDKKLDIKDALTNRIYYRDGKYYIKDLKYEYKPVPDNAIEIPNMAQFSENNYYKNNDNYYKEQKGYQHGNRYFELISGEEIIEKQLAEENWEPGKYWYKDANNNYILDDNTQPDENQEYYKINNKNPESVITVDHKKLYFFPNAYSDTVFNELFPTSEWVENDIVKGNGLFYWGTDTETGYQNYLPFEKTIPTNSTLFYIENYTIETSTTVDKGIIKTYDFQNAIKTEISTIPFQNNKFYYLNENKYQLLDNLADITLDNINEESDNYKKYYAISNNENEEASITFIPIGYDFYQPGLYYYKDNVDYILAKERIKLSNTVYYTIDASQAEIDTNVTFYEPNKYYYNNGSEYVIDTNETMTKDRKYYKDIYNTYVIKTGEKCNPNVNYADLGINIGYREEKYEWKELNGFSRTLNTINGLILKINNILKSDDNFTRDNKTIQGCINQINDIINRIDILKPSYFIGVDEYGHMTSMEPKGDNWIDVSVNRDKNDAVIINHIGPVAKEARNENNKEPLFGETFEIEDWVFDDKGHKTNISKHTVKIPQGSLTAAAANGSDVLTQLDFIPSTGEIKTTRENIANLKLNSYTKNSENSDIVDTDTLGGALSKLQTQIIEEETARANAISSTMDSLNKAIEKEVADRNAAIKVETDACIEAVNKEISDRQAAIKSETDARIEAINQEVTDRNAAIKVETDARIEAIEKEVTDRNTAIKVETDARIAAINALDATITTESSELITSITQTDGLVSAGKKKVGDLTLGGWALGQSTVNNESIADTDTINNAFAKAQRQINANKLALSILNGNDTTPGSVAYQIAQIVAGADAKYDTLKEIADWIISDTTGAAKMNADIMINATAIKALEDLVGNTVVATQIAEAINKALVIDGQDKYALATDLINLSTELNSIAERVKNLEDAVSADKIVQWNAAEANVQSDWNESDDTSDAYILNKPDLTNMIETTSQFDYTVGDTTTQLTIAQLVAKVAELEATIQTLTAST